MYTLFNLEFTIAKNKLVSSSYKYSSINTTKTGKLRHPKTLNNENESYCRIFREKSEKLGVLKESRREFNSLESMYEKECR